jgi:MFS family permease
MRSKADAVDTRRTPVDPARVRGRLILLLCVTVGASTFSIGSFPALLPDLDRVAKLSTVELGLLVSAFGFARMVIDIPVGLFVARRLLWAVRAAPFVLAAGVLVIGTGGAFLVLLAGRILMGFAHALGMVAWLTTILRYQATALGAALNAFELSAMLGMLGGVAVVSALPRSLVWNQAFIVACAPVLVGLITAPVITAWLRAVPPAHPPAVRTAPHDGHRSTMSPPPPGAPGRDGPDAAALGTAAGNPARTRTSLVPLAFVIGSSIAVTYATTEQFLLPLRASREFGLDRVGVARLLVVAQVADIIALLPVGLVADRAGPTRVLTVVLCSLSAAALLLTFGGVTEMAVGAALLGLGMAGWMLPLTLLRRETPASDIAWRTALYRVGVDGGLFLGPFLCGLLGDAAWALAATFAALLVALAVVLFTRPAGSR